MQLEQLAVALRPRGGWEALDLGFQMARQWWRPIWSAWIVVYLPAAAAAIYLFAKPFHAVVLLWWLKPLFDRVVLHVASRAVFGDPQGVARTLRAAGDWLRPGLIGALTFYRFDFARSFALPVWQLEKQKGLAGRRRRRALGGRMRSYAVWLWVVCAHLEWVAMFALFGIMQMLEPSMGELVPQEGDQDTIGFWAAFTSWTLSDALYYVGAVSLIEPFYVCAGFALYLNRRAVLEGWDIELALRRVQERLGRTVRAAAALLAGATVAGAFWLHDLPAAAAQPSAEQEIERILATPEFSQYREIKQWRYLGVDKPKEKKGSGLFWANLSQLFGEVAERALWVAATILVVLAMIYGRRFLPHRAARSRAVLRPPDVLFGMEVTPQSLPEDISGTAARLAGEGRLREALSLLYRGALSALVHRHSLALSEGQTEDDCVRAARDRLTPASSQYFAALVATWQRTAYAARPPGSDAVAQLCSDWPVHFAADVSSGVAG